MRNLILSDEALNLIKTMKGKKLHSLEGKLYTQINVFVESFRVNLNKTSIEFSLDDVPFDWTSPAKTNEVEDAEILNAQLTEVPKTSKKICVFPIEETISKVTIIRDYIGTNMNDEFVIDQGLIITTDQQSYSFIRNSIWNFDFGFGHQDCNSISYTEKKAIKDLANIITGVRFNIEREYLTF